MGEIKKRTREIDENERDREEVSHISMDKVLIIPLSLCFFIAEMEIIIPVPRLL